MVKLDFAWLDIVCPGQKNSHGARRENRDITKVSGRRTENWRGSRGLKDTHFSREDKQTWSEWKTDQTNENKVGEERLHCFSFSLPGRGWVRYRARMFKLHTIQHTNMARKSKTQWSWVYGCSTMQTSVVYRRKKLYSCFFSLHLIRNLNFMWIRLWPGPDLALIRTSVSLACLPYFSHDWDRGQHCGGPTPKSTGQHQIPAHGEISVMSNGACQEKRPWWCGTSLNILYVSHSAYESRYCLYWLCVP